MSRRRRKRSESQRRRLEGTLVRSERRFKPIVHFGIELPAQRRVKRIAQAIRESAFISQHGKSKAVKPRPVKAYSQVVTVGKREPLKLGKCRHERERKRRAYFGYVRSVPHSIRRQAKGNGGSRFDTHCKE